MWHGYSVYFDISIIINYRQIGSLMSSLNNFKRTLLSSANKENVNRESSTYHSAFTSNFHRTANSEKDIVLPHFSSSHQDNSFNGEASVSDSRFKLVMEDKEGLQKMYSELQQKSKNQCASLRKKICSLENTNIALDQKLTQYEGQIASLRKKLKSQGQKVIVLQKNLERLEQQRQKYQEAKLSSRTGVSTMNYEHVEVSYSNIRTQQTETAHNYEQLEYERRQMEELKMRNQQTEQLNKQFQRYIQTLQSQLQSLKEQKESQREMAPALQLQYETTTILEQQIEQITKQWQNDQHQWETSSKQYLNEINKLKLIIQEMSDKLAQQEVKIKVLSDDIEFRTDKIKKIQIQLVEKQKMIQSKAQQTQVLNQQLIEHEKLVRQIKNLELKLLKKQEVIQDNAKTIQTLNENIIEQERTCRQMQTLFKQEIQILVDSHSKENLQVQQTIQKTYQLTIKSDIQILNRSIQQKQQHFSQLSLKYEHLQAQKKNIAQQNGRLIDQIQQQKRNNSKMRNQLEETCREYQEEIKQLKESLKEVCISEQQLKKGISLQVGKNEELNELISCFKQKLYEEKERSQRGSELLKTLEQAYQEKQMEFNSEKLQLKNQLRQVNNLLEEEKNNIESKIRQFERERNVLREEVQCLEKEVSKWKAYRAENSQQSEDLRRDNRSLKNDLADLKQLNQKQADKILKMEQLQQKMKSVSLQNKRTIENYERQIEQIKSKHITETTLITQQLSKIESEMHMKVESQKSSSHQKQFHRRDLERKDQQIRTLLDANEELDRQLAWQRNELETLKRQLSKIKNINEELRRKLDDERLSKQNLAWEAEGMVEKIKKLESLNRKCQFEIGKLQKQVEQSGRTQWINEQKIDALQRTIKSLQIELSQNLQLLHEQRRQKQSNINKQIQKLNQTISNKNSEVSSLNEINKSKTMELSHLAEAHAILKNEFASIQSKNTALSANYAKLKLENEHLLVQNSSLSSNLSKLQLEYSQIQADSLSVRQRLNTLHEQNSKLTAQVSAKENCQKQKIAYNQQRQKSDRVEIYLKLVSLSNEFFAVEFKDSEIQFLTVLYHKMRIWVDYTAKLKEEMVRYRQIESAKDKHFSRSQGKQLEANLSLREDYEVVYRKYLKYKEAYSSCRSKMEQQRHNIVQDQRFTEQIISHCKTIIQQKQGRERLSMVGSPLKK